MVLTGESRSTGGKTCSRAIENMTKLIWTDLGWNPNLRGEI